MSGTSDATAPSILPIAGILPTPNGVVPLPGAASKIAESERLVKDATLISPLTIPIVIGFSNKWPAV